MREGRVLSRSRPATNFGNKAQLPPSDRGLARTRAAGDSIIPQPSAVRSTIRAPPHVFLRAVPIRHDRHELPPVGFIDVDCGFAEAFLDERGRCGASTRPVRLWQHLQGCSPVR